MTLCQDLAHKSLAEIQYGAHRYRTASPPNKWFPTPGAWLEACKNPYDERPRKYADLPPLPEPMPESRAKQVIESARRKFGYTAGEKATDSIKEEILARPPIEMTPEMIALEKSLAQERLDTLARRLSSRHG